MYRYICLRRGTEDPSGGDDVGNPTRLCGALLFEAVDHVHVLVVQSNVAGTPVLTIRSVDIVVTVQIRRLDEV